MSRYYDVDRMRILRELGRRGTMSAVAEALAFSRSAISQQLAQLEQEVGAPLLEKDGRRVRLTHEGELVVESAERIVTELEELRARIRTAGDAVAGVLRIASMQTVTLALLPPVLSELRATHADLEVVTVQAEPDVALSGLLARDFDVVITESYPQWPVIYPPGVRAGVVLTEPIQVACASTSDLPDKPTLEDFAEYRWAMEPRGTPAREWANSLCRTAGFIPKLGLETADMISQAHYAARGEVVAFLPDLVWRIVDLDVRLCDVGEHARRELHVVIRDGTDTDPAIVEFQRVLEGVVSSMNVSR